MSIYVLQCLYIGRHMECIYTDAWGCVQEPTIFIDRLDIDNLTHANDIVYESLELSYVYLRYVDLMK